MRAEAHLCDNTSLGAGTPASTALAAEVGTAPELQHPILCRDGRKLLEAIRDIQERVAAMPVLDSRSDDEIIGYNEYGHFD